MTPEAADGATWLVLAVGALLAGQGWRWLTRDGRTCPDCKAGKRWISATEFKTCKRCKGTGLLR